MRKTTLVLLCVLILSVSLLAQYERTPVQLPFIGEVIAKLDKATGWMQSPSGEWIERENRIPKYLSNDYVILLDYEEYSLGVDNFYWIELREVEIQGITYYLLLKACYGGQYRYPTIEKGWSKNYQIGGYIFDKRNWKAEFVDREPFLLRIELKYEVGLVYYHEPTKEEYIPDLSRKINEILNKNSNKDFTYFLNLNILPIDDAVRFIFLEEYTYHKRSTYSGLFETSKLPIRIEEVVTPKVFEKFYYETGLEVFKKLFP